MGKVPGKETAKKNCLYREGTGRKKLTDFSDESKHLPRFYRNHQGNGPGKEYNQRFEPSARFKENTVQCIAQRLGTHGKGEGYSDHLSRKMRRCLCLDHGHHLHGKDRGKYHNEEAAYRQHQIIQNSGV